MYARGSTVGTRRMVQVSPGVIEVAGVLNSSRVDDASDGFCGTHTDPTDTSSLDCIMMRRWEDEDDDDE
jgi:hypothetical protein